MATHEQSYRAGEAKGQTQEKAGQMMGTVQDKAEQAKDKTFDTAQAAKDKLSGAAQATKDRSHDNTRAAGETKEHAGGVIQATTEQVKNAAAGAADAVKRTLGMDGTTTTTTTAAPDNDRAI